MLREGTSDGWIWRSVFERNEYGLLDLTGRTVVDVGANIGAFACLAAERGASRVVAVEPFGPNFEVLERNVAPYAQITSLRRALGAASGETLTMRTTEEFVEQAAKEFPGKPVNFGGFHVGEHVGGSDRIDTISLPDLLSQLSLQRIDVLKLDCESAEWPVLAALRPEDFARIGEMCGEYHLVGNVSVLGDVDPLHWLRSKLEANGFVLELASHETNDRLGWFYARSSSVAAPACEFLSKRHAKAKPQAANGGAPPEVAALRKDLARLEAKLAEQGKRLAAQARTIADQQRAIADMRDAMGLLRKARKLRRDPIAFFRDALARPKAPGRP